MTVRRINEKQIGYCWLVHISRSFAGWCWLFSLKFEASDFRDIHNPEELIRGIFTIGKAGDIENLHVESQTGDISDPARGLSRYDLFEANPGIALDGIDYEYLIFAPNTTIRMHLNNPNSENWRLWEQEVWKMGTDLARRSGITGLAEIFEP